MGFPTLVLKNQFGEQSNNTVLGGSSQLYVDFIVDSTNGNGLGLRTIKGNGVSKIFMHTSATPATGSPNPAAGTILIQLSAGYSGYVNGNYGFNAPLSGTPINVTTGVTAHLTYVIVTLGTTTSDQWLLLGVPVGVTPAVGVAFVAPATATATGTGTIEIPKSTGSGIAGLELIGDPNVSSLPTDGSGAWIICQTFDYTGALAAPADGTVIGLTFNMLDNPSAELI